MIKINTNFEELDLRDDEQTTVSNLGSVGEGLYYNKVNYDLQFKKIAGSDKITLTADENKIVISADVGLDTLTINSDSGNVTLDDVASFTIAGGDGITTSIVDSTLTIENTNIAELVEDLTPQLGGNLDAQGNDLLNVGVVNASTITGFFAGNMEGNVWGYDIRDWAEWNAGFDFGGIVPDYSSLMHFLVTNIDVDLGTFGAPASGNIDLGSI
jgi:hypothetical protein